MSLENQESADVRRRQAGKPPILSARVDGRRRGEHGGLDRDTGELGQPGQP